MATVTRFLEAIVVFGFLSSIAARELLRADGGERATLLLRRTFRPVAALAVVFVVLIGTKFYDLAT